jgi:23S rRNA (cytosine1962-C5)-methyltransferase
VSPENPDATSPTVNGPVAVVSRRAADRLRAGHVWVYRSDVEDLPGVEPDADPSQLPVPGLIPVTDHRGILLGTALYSAASEISLRLVSRDAIATEADWLALVSNRLKAAIELRRPMLSTETDSCRLVFSEADALPGIIADRYGDLVVLQLLTKALDNDAIRIVVAETLRQSVLPETIVERPDPRIRELEQLSAPSPAPLYAQHTDEPLTKTIFHLNGLKFHYDANSGQKTGAFLDQRENYAAAARYAHGEALDVCTYQGGFALHLAKACARVTGIDVSRAALEVAEKNLAENRDALTTSQVDWIEANAFDLLRDWSDSGTQYDTIALDPPAFAKSKRAVEGAIRGYKELNLRALKMLRPGGVLVTCSCSHHVSLNDFTEERRGAAADHPVILTIPETEYLKCLICEIS